MRLKDLVEIKKDMKKADFWLDKNFEVVNEYNKNNIGFKIVKKNIILSDFLKYYLEYSIPKWKLQQKLNITFFRNLEIESVKEVVKW